MAKAPLSTPSNSIDCPRGRHLTKFKFGAWSSLAFDPHVSDTSIRSTTKTSTVTNNVGRGTTGDNQHVILFVR